jgi:hypothetical protein
MDINDMVYPAHMDLSEPDYDGRVLHEVPGDSLKGADLRGVYLRGADLRGVDLRGADIREADLTGADLTEADLTEANLTDACLCGADLHLAYLCKTNLSGADLRGVDLSGADLAEADLTGANLSMVSLSEANLSGTVLPPPIVPSEGEFIGYKKVLQADGTYTVITLRIPADAQRTSVLSSRKCRASHAIVVEGEGVSPTYGRILTYTPGTPVTADHFNADRREECTNGIHFFMTREEAEAYQP